MNLYIASPRGPIIAFLAAVLLTCSIARAQTAPTLIKKGAYVFRVSDARITFRREDVTERRVDSGEFRDIRYEKTTYRYPKPGEID